MDQIQTEVEEPSLARFLAENYQSTKARYPGEGRRKWRLRVAEAFWNLSHEFRAAYLASISQNLLSAESVEDADFTTDDDPLDDLSDNTPGLGIILRTDYGNEESWQAFCSRLRDAEAEFASADLPEDSTPDTPGQGPSAAHGAATSTTDADGDWAMDAEDVGDDDEDDEGAAMPPAGTKRIRPPNRLIDHDGWQEVYSGKVVWVYDSKSNEDQCVRLVGQKGATMYGTATGDSWRARVSHICELQVNLATGMMTIDFGGSDRWDYAERARNLQEAVKSIS